MSPYRSAGARWLSEDEGVDTAKKVDRYSDEDVTGARRKQQAALASSASPSAKERESALATRSQQSHSSSLHSNTQEVVNASGASPGSSVVSRSRVPSAGLLAAKAQWKAMESTGRRRLRRANSQQQAPEPNSRDEEADSSVPISGHPIAPNDGVPMPSIRDIAPMRRTSGGVSTYQSNEGVEEPVQHQSPTPVVDVESLSISRRHSNISTASAATSGRAANIPDYAEGRGGDGIGGVGAPSELPVSNEEEEQAKVDFKKKLLPELKSILTCPVCVSDKSRTSRTHPFLVQPITLRCGHTVCLSHVDIPTIPAPNVDALPTTEAHAKIAAWNSNRLGAWAIMSCPIPFCRQHSGEDVTKDASGSTVPAPESTSNQAEGIALYPQSRPIAHGSAEPINPKETITFNSKGAPVDFTISKVLAIILRELEQERLASLPPSQHPASSALATDADNEDTEGSSDAGTSEGATDVSFAEFAFAHHQQNADSSFLPPRQTASRPRHTRPQVHTQTEKRRRSKAVDLDKSPSATSPPSKRSQLPSGLPSVPHRNSYSFEKELALTLECDVCTSLFFEPITTPCGHTFCSRCLARSLDHSSRCPVCRQDLPNFAFYQDHPVNKVLTTVVLSAFPEDLEERRRSIEEEERDARLDTPIFVCTLAFPGMPCILHVFEPRYRLMLRRCVESGHPRFGMVLPARGSGNPNMAGVMEYGTMLDIKSIQMLPDGRSMVEAVGSYRFRLLEKGSLDGYTVGRIERIDDISPEDEAMLERLSLERARNARSEVRRALRAAQINGSESPDQPQPAPPPLTTATNGQQSSANARPGIARALSTDHQPHGAAAIGLPDLQPGEVEPSTEELMRTCQAFIDQLRSGSAPWLLQRLNNTYGPMPEDPTLFSFWMALVMPIDEYEKARLLPIRSPRLRLRLIAHWVDQLRSSWW
ncbi:hypothetical protein NCC49_006439 [Naganishia albida]|nr:hypothetical protein NCC49_006439 [Naganishia albida]